MKSGREGKKNNLMEQEGIRNKEQGTRNKEQGTRNKEKKKTEA